MVLFRLALLAKPPANRGLAGSEMSIAETAFELTAET